MAGLIPQSFIEDLLTRVDIVEVIDSRTPLKRAGKNYTGLCPFHQEKTPSFSVSPDKQFYHCFGCGAGGNAISFLMDYDSLEFVEVIEQLASQAGLVVPQGNQRDDQKTKQRATIYDLLQKVDEYYQEQLRSHNEAEAAKQYLKARGLSGQLAKQFGLGFAPPGWQNLLHRFPEEEQRKMLHQCGLLVDKEDGGRYDRFRHRITFPIRDQRGRAIAFGGRVMGDDKPKYINSPESPVFHKSQELYGLFEARKSNRDLKRIIVVEGYMDVIMLAQHGFTETVATLGTAINTSHLERVFRNCSEVIFCFDGDRAGKAAAWRALEAASPIMTDGRRAKFLMLPEGEDPDSLVQKDGPERFGQRLQEAQSLSDYLFSQLMQNIDMDGLDGRAQLAAEARPLIQKFPRGVFYQLMVDKLAELTGMSKPDMASYLNTGKKSEPMRQQPSRPQSSRSQNSAQQSAGPGFQNNRPVSRAPVNKGFRQHQLPSLDSATMLLLHSPSLANVAPDLSGLDAENNPELALLIELITRFKQDPQMNIGILMSHWQGTPKGARVVQLASRQTLLEEEMFEPEFLGAIQRLRESEGEARFKALSQRPLKSLSAEEKVELREWLAHRS
ncbi:MAG: DNA primase [Pseudomonadales bacterium]|nr:DNA primase [Pseudomonadales bacterium]